jgi:hypothetical protein
MLSGSGRQQFWRPLAAAATKFISSDRQTRRCGTEGRRRELRQTIDVGTPARGCSDERTVQPDQAVVTGHITAAAVSDFEQEVIKMETGLNVERFP